MKLDMKNTPVDDKGDPIPVDKTVRYWRDQVDDARKREKNFRKEADRVIGIYEAEKAEEGASSTAAFNVLYANTETLSPAVYNTVPRVVVKRRYKDDTPVAIQSAKVLQRALEFLLDSNEPDYSTFDDLQKSAVAEALVPGRGLSRFRYTSQMTEGVEADDENPAVPPTVKSEHVCGEEVPWNRVFYGYAKRWSQTPWMAYEHFMTRQEVTENFGEEIGNNIKLTASASDNETTKQDLPANAEGVKFAQVYEVWCKTSRKVYFISEGFPTPLKTEDDPMKLTGFYPSPRPIMFLTKIKSLVPQTLYLMYETQAKELNDVTVRIGKITRALKVRGFYDSTLSGLDNLMTAEDNTLLPAQNVAAMQQGQTLDAAIWLMPIEKLVAVLQQLYVNRTQVQSVIQQLTGIADIMRGSSQASETLGAQKMKESWGTMRLKRMQKEVQRYARDSLRIMAEILCTSFDQTTLAKMTGIKLPTNAEKQQMQMQAQQIQMQTQMQAQAPGQPPTSPPQLPPELQEGLATPSWEEVMTMLADDTLRNYVIDIETNSTIDAEATEDKQDVAEFMNAMAQLLNGLMPMVEKGFMSFDVAKSMMLTVVKRFRFGADVEEQIKSMKAPPPPPPGGAPDPVAEAKAAALAQEAKFAAEKHQATMSQLQQSGQMDAARLQADMQALREERALAEAALRASYQKLADDAELSKINLQMARQKASAAAAVPKPTQGKK